MTTRWPVHLVSVTEVRMSPDLRHATVFVKPLLGQDEEAVLKALRTHTAFLQREVARRVRTKYAAKLKFLADESFDEGSQIDKLAARRARRAGPRRRMIDVGLAAPMTGDGCRAELFAEQHRDALQGRLRRGSRHLADLLHQLRSAGFRRRRSTVLRQCATTAPSSCSTATSWPACRASSASTKAASASRSAAPIIARTCAAPASTGGSRT